jgi:hypothetical protein
MFSQNVNGRIMLSNVPAQVPVRSEDSMHPALWMTMSTRHCALIAVRN